jgi:hypothetical protein
MLIDQQHADAHYVFSVCMEAAVYSHLLWKDGVDAHVPIHTEEGLGWAFWHLPGVILALNKLLTSHFGWRGGDGWTVYCCR